MNWLLKIIDREDQRVVQKHIIPPAGSLRIGRNSQLCDIALEDKSLSRQHFSIVSSRDGLQVHDMNSTLGTFVNGRKIVTGSSETIAGALPDLVVRVEAGKRFDFELTCLAATATPPGSPALPAAPMAADTHTIGLDQPLGRPVEYPASTPASSPIATFAPSNHTPLGTPEESPTSPALPLNVQPYAPHAHPAANYPPQPYTQHPDAPQPYATSPVANEPVRPVPTPPSTRQPSPSPTPNQSGSSNYSGNLKLDLGQLNSFDESDFADENW